MVAYQILPSLKGVWSVYIGDYPDYVQMIVEFADGVLVTDAPAHRSKTILQWVKEQFGKDVKWIVPSHHHRDHAGGVADYVAAGAKVVVPEVAKRFYEAVNNGSVEILTFTEEKPFTLRDGNVQFRSMWKEESPHARDWTYNVAMKDCPSSKHNDTAMVFIADVISPDSGPGTRCDLGYARQLLDWAISDCLPRDTILVGSHGGATTGSTTQDITAAIDIIGIDYPPLKIEDFTRGGPVCV